VGIATLSSVTTAPETTPEVTEESVAMIQPTATQAATATPVMTATAAFTPTPAPPTPTPQPTDNIAATFAAADAELNVSSNTWPIDHLNTGFRWEEQTWNNCGPANITMALSYFGWGQEHIYAANRLKPYREDKNVSPWELARFANEYTDYNALYRYGGDLDMLRSLVSAGFPVIIERSHMFEGYDWIGHYQTIVGYDDQAREFIILDSFLGAGDDGLGIIETYGEVDAGWQQFNRVFVVAYRPGQENQLMQILDAERLTIEASAEHAFMVAQEEARENPNNAFAWFNMGTSLVELGRYEEAATAYDKAISLEALPWRMLWYQFGPFEAYYNVGRYDDVLQYAANNLSNNGRYVEETYYWQGRALAAQGDTDGARNAFSRALRYNSNFEAARQARDSLGT
jgi:tetratricopeptide (TPR) repeat protein